MTKTNRSALKEHFQPGSIPKAKHFEDLIDSMLIQGEDNIDKLSSGPLSVKPFGPEETLINFSPLEQPDKPGWQLKQKAGDKPGLSISEGPDSRLFIENGTGNMGIGVTKPTAKLDVSGNINIEGASSELFFQDSGQIRSADDNHRILFRRGENTLELREYGQIVFSPGATKGQETARVTFAASGNVGIGTTASVAKLDVQQEARTDTHPKAVKGLYVTGGFAPDSDGVEFRHTNGSQGIGFGYNTIYATGSNANQELGLKPRGTSPVVVHGNLRVEGIVSVARDPVMKHRMYPADPLVYQDIFDARDAKVIAKYGNPWYDDGTYYKPGSWGGRRIIRYGRDNENDGNGAIVTIPTGYDTVWLRVLGERWTLVKAYFTDGQGEQLGHWVGGWRATNSYSPDGSLSDGYQVAHQWLPIPAGRSGNLALIPKNIGGSGTGGEFWLSGVAFSRNPWAHATQAAVAFLWASNGGNRTTWADGWHAWHNDVLTKIEPGTNQELIVPVRPSGRDKLLYLVEHNSDWNGAMHSGITVNGQPIERLMASYDNPFARHWNSKWYERYLAARIPAALISAGQRWLSVRIDMTKQDQGIHFREIGTHDLDVPLA